MIKPKLHCLQIASNRCIALGTLISTLKQFNYISGTTSWEGKCDGVKAKPLRQRVSRQKYALRIPNRTSIQNLKKHRDIKTNTIYIIEKFT